MFQFPGFASRHKCRDDTPSVYRVSPFGNLRIKGYLHLPEAYRSLSRPSSPLRAKASAIRPYLTFLFILNVCKINLTKHWEFSFKMSKNGLNFGFSAYGGPAFSWQIVGFGFYQSVITNLCSVINLWRISESNR